MRLDHAIFHSPLAPKNETVNKPKPEGYDAWEKDVPASFPMWHVQDGDVGKTVDYGIVSQPSGLGLLTVSIFGASGEWKIAWSRRIPCASLARQSQSHPILVWFCTPTIDPIITIGFVKSCPRLQLAWLSDGFCGSIG
jgi:hypothetical protein